MRIVEDDKETIAASDSESKRVYKKCPVKVNEAPPIWVGSKKYWIVQIIAALISGAVGALIVLSVLHGLLNLDTSSQTTSKPFKALLLPLPGLQSDNSKISDNITANRDVHDTTDKKSNLAESQDKRQLKDEVVKEVLLQLEAQVQHQKMHDSVRAKDDGEYALWSQGRLVVTNDNGESLLFDVNPSLNQAGIWSNLGVKGNLNVHGEGAFKSLASRVLQTQELQSTDLKTEHVKAAKMIAENVSSQSIKTTTLDLLDVISKTVDAEQVTTDRLQTNSSLTYSLESTRGEFEKMSSDTATLNNAYINSAEVDVMHAENLHAGSIYGTVQDLSLDNTSAGVITINPTHCEKIQESEVIYSAYMPIPKSSNMDFMLATPLYVNNVQPVQVGVVKTDAGFEAVATWFKRETSEESHRSIEQEEEPQQEVLENEPYEPIMVMWVGGKIAS